MNLSQPFDFNMRLLSKMLDLRARNQEVIASNIANAETPGYSPATFHFQEALREAVGGSSSLPMEVSNPRHITNAPTSLADVNGTVTTSKDDTGIGDKNGVKVDQEMIALSKNELMYETAATLLQKKLGMLKYAINGG